MKLFYILILALFQLQASSHVSCAPEACELAVFVRSGLHANHYWACDHTALVEVTEVKEKETDLQVDPASFDPVMTVLRFSPYLRLPILNPQKLQWTNLPLFVLLGNFRL
jgi:hypothetical protein